MPRLSSILLLPLLLASCEGCGGTEEIAGARASTATEGSGSGEAAAEPGDPPPDPGPAPTLAVRGEPEPGGVVHVIVENHGREPVVLAATLEIEREEPGGWAAVEGIAGLSLRRSCEESGEECLTLVPGAELHPPAWLGTIGDAQCICTRCAPAPEGRYRFVVATCDGEHRVEGEAFSLAQ